MKKTVTAMITVLLAILLCGYAQACSEGVFLRNCDIDEIFCLRYNMRR